MLDFPFFFTLLYIQGQFRLDWELLGHYKLIKVKKYVTVLKGGSRGSSNESFACIRRVTDVDKAKEVCT